MILVLNQKPLLPQIEELRGGKKNPNNQTSSLA